jgi:hypothetical protein
MGCSDGLYGWAVGVGFDLDILVIAQRFYLNPPPTLQTALQECEVFDFSSSAECGL